MIIEVVIWFEYHRKFSVSKTFDYCYQTAKIEEYAGCHILFIEKIAGPTKQNLSQNKCKRSWQGAKRGKSGAYTEYVSIFSRFATPPGAFRFILR
jgi:hypothetical protein